MPLAQDPMDMLTATAPALGGNTYVRPEADIDAEIAALEAELGQGDYAPVTVPDAMPDEAAVDAEIAALEAELGGGQEQAAPQGTTLMQDAATLGRNAYQGLTGNFGDEAISMLGALGAKGYGYLTGNEAVKEAPLSDLVTSGMNIQQDQLAKDAAQSPWLALSGQVAGSVPTAIAGASALASRAPTLMKFIEGATLAGKGGAAATAGAVSGGLAGFGGARGGFGERLEGGTEGAALGGAMGPLGAAGGAALSSGTSRLKGLAQRAAKAFGLGADSVPTAPAQALPARELPSIEAISQGEAIRLPTGAKTGDVEMMRAEESARQGLLGPDYQASIGQVDRAVQDDAAQATSALAGGVESSEAALMGGINKVRSRAAAEKRMATRLIESRNDKIARAGIHRDYTNETLTKQVEELAQTPDFKVALAKESNKPIAEDINYLRSLTSGEQKSLNFADLAAWRSNLNGYRPATQEGVLAGKIAKQYDGWLDGIAKEALINADDDLIEQIGKANRAYAAFKQKTGTNRYKLQSDIVEKITRETDLTPRQIVNMTFGSGMGGKDTSGQVVRRMLDIVPEGPKREALQGDFRHGLVQRAFEQSYDAGKEKLSIAKLKDNLLRLKTNDVYKDYLATPEHAKAMDGLIRDLGKYVDATSRRDVHSPSGGAVTRGLDMILTKAGTVLGPFGGRIATDTLKQFNQNAMKGPDRALVEKSLRRFSKQIGDEMDGSPTAYLGGAVTSGNVAPGDEEPREPVNLPYVDLPTLGAE